MIIAFSIIGIVFFVTFFIVAAFFEEQIIELTDIKDEPEIACALFSFVVAISWPILIIVGIVYGILYIIYKLAKKCETPRRKLKKKLARMSEEELLKWCEEL